MEVLFLHRTFSPEMFCSMFLVVNVLVLNGIPEAQQNRVVQFGYQIAIAQQRWKFRPSGFLMLEIALQWFQHTLHTRISWIDSR